MSKLEEVGSAYNRGTALRLSGPLQWEQLKGAIYALLARHEALRSHYPAMNGVPTVQVSAPEDIVVDINEPAGGSMTLDEALTRASEYLNQPFDLESGPLFRCALYRLGDDDHLLLLGVHEIVADGTSWNIVLSDLAALYSERITGQSGRLDQPRTGFFELAAQRRAELVQDDEDSAEGLDYWLAQLEGSPSLEFPAFKPRPSVQSHRGDTVRFRIGPTVRERLERLGSEQAATPFMVYLAIFQLFLVRYSRQDDVVVGIAEAGRSSSASEGIVGFFLNTLAIRTRFSGDLSFRDLLEQIFTHVLSAVEHAYVPFDRVVRHLGIRRDSSRSPVFQAMLTYERSPARDLSFAGLQVLHEPLHRQASMFDLSLYLVDHGPELHCELEYSTDLYDKAFIEQCAGYFTALMERILEAPDAPVLSLPLVDDATTRSRVVQRAGPEEASLPVGSFLEWITERVRLSGDRPAVEDEDGTRWSYAQLWDYAGRIARGLDDNAVARGALVGVEMERGASMLGVILGILRHGAAYLPLDPAFPAERLRYMVEDSGAAVMVSDAPHDDFGDIPAFDPGILAESATATPDEVFLRAEDLAYVIYTSGSTGRPKGVEITHGALRNFLGSMQQELRLTGEDVLLAVTTLSFDIAGLELFLPLCVGARVVIAGAGETDNGAALLERLELSGATTMQATPASWRMLLDAGWDTHLQRVLCGGESLSGELARALLKRGVEVWNLYGPTETTIWSTLERLTDADAVSVGRPIANTRVYVLDAYGHMVPDGVPGEIWIAGAGVARGYLGQPELTHERFRPDPFVPGERMYRTGDLGRWRTDGRLEHLGRLDFQLKVHGFRIEAGEIEATLERLPEVREAVVSVNGEDEDRRLVAYVVFQMGQQLLPTEIRRRLMHTLPRYMVPGLVVSLDAMPLTPNGKIDRKALPDPLAMDRRELDFEPPQGVAEEAIAAVWQELLPQAQVGRHDNFFELGGHSLLAMQVVVALEKRLPEMRLQPRDMYYLSVSQLAALVDSNGGAEVGNTRQ